MRFLGLFVCTACSVADFDTTRTNIDSIETPNKTEDPLVEDPTEVEPRIEFGTTGLPDLRDEMDATVCDESNGVAGYTNYVLGTYVQNQGFWEGEEIWFLLPNSEKEMDGYESCQIRWDVRVEEESDCENCDYLFSVQATLDEEQTTCPEEFWRSEPIQNWNNRYRVVNDKLSTEFQFASSQNAFGWGFNSDRALNFLTQPYCTWN